MKHYDNIIFDLDGTLVDTEILYMKTFSKLAGELGCDVPQEKLFSFAGTHLPVKLEYLKNTYNLPHSTDELEARYREIRATGGEKYSSYLFSGTIPTLERLKGMGKRLFVCSNTMTVHVFKILNECAIAKYFEGVFTRTDAGVRKPDPRIYLMMLEKYRLDVGRTLAVEDSDAGVDAAAGAGLFVIAIRDKRFGFKLEKANAETGCIQGVADYIERSENV